MLESGDGLGLGAEAGAVFFRREARIAHHLECNEPVQAFLPGLVDDAHPAAAQLFEDFIIPERRGRLRLRSPRTAVWGSRLVRDGRLRRSRKRSGKLSGGP